jgi:hypothetical protein
VTSLLDCYRKHLELHWCFEQLQPSFFAVLWCFGLQCFLLFCGVFGQLWPPLGVVLWCIWAASTRASILW